LSGRLIWMNSPWGHQRKPLILGLPAILGTGNGSPVALVVALQRLSPQTNASQRSVPIRAVLSVSQQALCGVVGLKPTYGRVSRFGLIAFASSLDQLGPITKDVEDCAILLNHMAGYDPKESTSIPEPVPDYRTFLRRDIKGWTIGVPREYFLAGIEPEVEAAAKRTIEILKDLGAQIRDISLPHTPYSVATYYIIAPAEASSNLARYDGVKYGFRAEGGRDLLDMYKQTRSLGFGDEVKRRIIIGTYVLSSGYYDAYYKKASQVRALIRHDFDQAFTQCDVIPDPHNPDGSLRDRREKG